MGPAAAGFFDSPDRFIAKSDDELRTLDEPPTEPYWDVSLARDAGRRRDFILRLRDVGLVAWRLRARSFAGCFFVPKKDQLQRLVIDCRPANQLHRRPPHSELALPGALAQLLLSPEWLARCASGAPAPGPLAASEDSIFGAGIDLTDGYYQFLVPTASSYFCLGESWLASELNVSEVFCEDTGRMVAVSDDTQLWGCFGGLPMGWAWALFFCHEALSQASLAAQRRLGWPAHLVSDKSPPPPLTRGTAVVAPYVDNGNIVGGSATASAALLAELVRELETIGFVCRDRVEPTQDVYEMLGLILDRRRRVLRPKPSRTWRLWYALSTLVRRGRATGFQMRIVAGPWFTT